MTTFEARLPLPAKRPNATPPPDEIFLEALRREHGKSAVASEKTESGQAAAASVRAVILLPMSTRQIELFAQRSGLHDAAAFLAEIGRQDAWTFARRPLDLSELIATWTSAGHLGTRAQQHEANIAAKLKDDPDRPDHGILTDAKARLGAERLALALALTRTRTIRSPEQALDIQRAEGVLDPATILQDWTEQERQTLLRKALFDPATYGRIRFHHRSVQEFLAARHLQGLREKGMSTKALFRLLFAECYAVEVVIPSMRPITAWLALWDDAVRRELTKREPEVLLSLGDPESLSLPARAELVRAFVAAYHEGDWRGLDIPIDEVRRVAHPELAPTIRELWSNGPTNADVRDLLIEMIWKGPVEECADLARAAALDVDWTVRQRTVAVRALLACGHDTAAREIVTAILDDRPSWPDRIVYGVAADLFPKIMSVDQLMALMERTREPQNTVGGFEREARQIAEALDPRSDRAVALRSKMADLIWEGRNAQQEFYRICGRFDHLTPALAILCERQLVATSGEAHAELIRSCVIASRFHSDDQPGEPIRMLRARVREYHALRADVFWAELAFMDEVAPATGDRNRLYNAEHDSLIGSLSEPDRSWLEVALADESHPDRRPVALHALLSLWYQRGRPARELDDIRAALNGDPALTTIFVEDTAPLERSAKFDKMEEDHLQWKLEQANREEERLQSWMNWRKELLANPAGAFTAEMQSTTVANLYSWLDTLDRSRSRYNVWNKEALAQAFGEDIAKRAADVMPATWRTNPPVLWSARKPAERSSVPYVWLYGLCGLSAEATSPGWTGRLTSDEARIAAAYSTVELNGFAPFIADLVLSHPAEVKAVLGKELDDELKCAGDHPHLPILQDLSYADSALKRLLAPRLLAALPTWPMKFTTDTAPRWTHHVDHALGILGDTCGDADRASIAQQCAERYRADPAGPLALVWLRGLFRFDSEQGTRVLTGDLIAADEPATRARAIETFAALFGDHGAVLFGIPDPARRANALGILVRIAYEFIRREDDQVHEGSYSPNMRDNAETARNFLLSALLDTPGTEARRVILELATEPNFAHFPDRLRLLARKRAAADAEFAAFDPSEIVDLETRHEAPPHDRDGLFEVMMDRLDDLAHDISQHDFTDRRTLRTISDEAEMQRTLAWRIDAKKNGAFVVVREDEVADQKRTDIRLAAVRADQKVVIEVKLADTRWSLTDLERALRNQLVGQYLRHETCKAGCLLMTYDGQKEYWIHPVTGKRLNFDDMVAYLNERARALEIECRHDIRLAVFGLDLTDPVLAPAHRGSVP
jgi:hypothetical protein